MSYPYPSYPAPNGQQQQHPQQPQHPAQQPQQPLRPQSPYAAHQPSTSSLSSLSPPATPQQRSASPASSDHHVRRAPHKRHYPTYAVADQSILGSGTPPPPPPAAPSAPSAPSFQQQQPQFQQPQFQQAQFQQPYPQQPYPQQPYPQQPYPQQPYPQQPSPQQSHAHGYMAAAAAASASPAGLANGMANMSLYEKPLPPTRDDVPLVGQLPPVQDLDLPKTNPVIPPHITATPSPNAQCPAAFKRSTLNAIPNASSLLKKSRLPLAIHLEPHPTTSPDTEVPVVEDTVVSRCTRCKTYINPFVQFAQNALRWRCNMCGLENDVPSAFDWDAINQQHVDRWSRPELNYGCVDFVASAEYMVRPPQPPAYVFVIDTSYQAVQTGMVATVAEAILQSLDAIPNEDGRTKVGLITVDAAVGFYKLVGDEPEMLVVGDLSDIYLPRATGDLMVNLADAKTLVSGLLTKMCTMFNETHATQNCLGTALQAARKLLSSTGGKIICFQSAQPNIGEGAIKPSVDDTTKPVTERTLIVPGSPFYRTFATECTKAQVCADMFVFGGADVATLNLIPRFTGGQTHYYPNFKPADGSRQKVLAEVKAVLSERVGLEAVMRTRCSPGLVCHAFYGNFTTRNPDVMALPNVPRDQAYCVELAIEDDIQGNYAYFQTALLYTTCFGERRIRVMNLALPVVRSLQEVFASADQVMIARTLCHQAIDKAANNKLKDGREHLTKQTIDIASAYGREVMGSVASGAARLTLNRNLALLPLLVLGLLKSETFSDLAVIPPDVRAQSTVLLRTLTNTSFQAFVHPSFYSLHNMPPQAGTVPEGATALVLPPRVNLTSEKLERHGLYLVEDGQRIYLWLGREAVPPLCKDLLGVPDIQHVQSGPLELPTLPNPLSQRVHALLQHIRARRGSYYPTLTLIREDGDPALRALFLTRLIEDRMPGGPATAGANQEQFNSGMSYFQWLGFVRAKCQ